MNKEKRTIIALFVGDILITGLDETEIERAKDHFKAEYKMTEIGNISKYLGLDVTQSQNKTKLQVSQATYIHEMLETYGFKDSTRLPHRWNLELYFRSPLQKWTLSFNKSISEPSAH